MDVSGQLEDHQARCLPHLLTLRMLARDMPEAPLPWLAVAEVTRATEAILSEVEAAVRAVTGGGPGTRAFLDVRLSRPWPRPTTPSPRPGRRTSPSCAAACPGSRR